MKATKFRLIALILTITLLFTGCALDFRGYFSQLANVLRPVNFDNMTYTRPDPELLDDALDDCLSGAKGKNFDKLISQINTFNSICSRFQTNYYLAYIHYSIDTTDAYWTEEYNYCSRLNPTIQASVDELMYALADSPMREKLETDEFFGPGYFDRYDGESHWTDEFLALKNQEADLLNQYYAISSLSSSMDTQAETFYTAQMEQIYVDLVKVRNQMATETGFNSYAEYAYTLAYNRDYTPAQASTLIADIRQELVEPYSKLALRNTWLGMDASTEDQTFDYVKTMSQNMGGMVQTAFTTMENGGLYHISYGKNKINSSYTAYLPDYQVPFVFVNPTMTSYDRLTFSHEFGHFCNYFANGGSNTGIDVAEVFSQGLELLSLFYADGGKQMQQLKLADSLGVYIEQSFLADFENRVYRLSSDDLTAENIRNLYSQVATEYGLGDRLDSRGYVNVTHFFSSPMYVISYVVSMDTAMQFYQLENNQSGEGLRRYENNLSSSQSGFLAFLSEAQLESPFKEGHITEVRELFEKILNL